MPKSEAAAKAYVKKSCPEPCLQQGEQVWRGDVVKSGQSCRSLVTAKVLKFTRDTATRRHSCGMMPANARFGSSGATARWALARGVSDGKGLNELARKLTKLWQGLKDLRDYTRKD